MQKVFVALGVLVLALLAGCKAAQDTTVTPGFLLALRRDVALFAGEDPIHVE